MTVTFPKDKQIVVPILGMHRSGTSMLMRMLSLLGVDVGKNTLPANPDNKAGYWEDMAILEININLVKAVGCDWRGFASRSMLLKAAESMKIIDVRPVLSANISTYLENQFQSSHWGWKDPRTVLTFPFWQRCLNTYGYSSIRPIILVRHPVSCARSLVKVYPAEYGPHMYTFEAGIELWGDYYEILMSYMESDWQVIMQHDLLDQKIAKSVLGRCCKHINLHPKSLEIALQSINPELVSYQNPVDEVIVDSRVSEIYTYFTALARRQQKEFDESSK